MISLSMIPSSISGTKAGHDVSNMLRPPLYLLMQDSYALLAIVTFVPIIPILFFSVHLSAMVLAAGSIIPSIGICGNLSLRSSTHVALTVLQAITIIFAPLSTKKSAISVENRFMVVVALEPYGVLAVSPKYIILSSGSFFINGGTQVSPPSPESKKPIGLLSIPVIILSFCGIMVITTTMKPRRSRVDQCNYYIIFRQQSKILRR